MHRAIDLRRSAVACAAAAQAHGAPAMAGIPWAKARLLAAQA